MLYLYTLMMLAWDLDPDTHAYFRRYLEVFINKRKISKDLREFVRVSRRRAVAAHICPDRYVRHNFNELRISLPYRLAGYKTPTPWSWRWSWPSAPNLIENIHPPKYYRLESEEEKEGV